MNALTAFQTVGVRGPMTRGPKARPHTSLGQGAALQRCKPTTCLSPYGLIRSRRSFQWLLTPDRRCSGRWQSRSVWSAAACCRFVLKPKQRVCPHMAPFALAADRNGFSRAAADAVGVGCREAFGVRQLAAALFSFPNNVSVPIWPHSISPLIAMVFPALPGMQWAFAGAKRLECGSLLPLCSHAQTTCLSPYRHPRGTCTDLGNRVFEQDAICGPRRHPGTTPEQRACHSISVFVGCVWVADGMCSIN